MCFKLEVVFTGLGLVWIDPRDGSNGIKFMMLDDRKAERHRPRFSFSIEDLEKPERNFPWLTATNGSALVQRGIAKPKIPLQVTGGYTSLEVVWAKEGAAEPDCTNDAPVDAIDWIPSIKDHYGIDDLKDLKSANIFKTVISLPNDKGRLSSRRLLWNKNGQIAKWTFGDRNRRVLAEQVVWTCDGVENVTVPLENNYVFKADPRTLCDEQVPRTITLAFTNLPGESKTGKYPNPEHYKKFYKLSRSEKPPRQLKRIPSIGTSETLGGSCPPSRDP